MSNVLNIKEKVKLGLFSFLSDKCDKIKRFSDEKLFQVDGLYNTPQLREKLNCLLSDEDNFLAKARAYRDRLSGDQQDKKELTYYYFLLKFQVAEHESRFGTPPIQIYNEHRMAFDHYVRGLVEKDSIHYQKKIGHIRRALLDILKLNCAGYRKEINNRHKRVPAKAIGLISNGEYVKKFMEFQNEAEEILHTAKCEEYKIGNDVEQNVKVVEAFIAAYFAHKEWFLYQKSNLGSSAKISAWYYVFVSSSKINLIAIGLLINLVSELALKSSLLKQMVDWILNMVCRLINILC